jgi:hypothetical protein
MSRLEDAFAATVAIAAGLLIFGSAAAFVFSIAPHLNMPPVKSSQQLCEERGGVYIKLREGPRCFSKEAFK